ncbi:26S proteasome non-ATPase regulatory subunit [Blastocladiella emersonii ATCC 22665]|nr:26S proteasome non-ATPase regulatory subunit [Blastocladiella emersonii ATCC 22665]
MTAENKPTTAAPAAAMDVDEPAAAAAAAPVVDAEAVFLADIQQNVTLLGKAVADLEGRFVTRVLRTTAGIRKRLSAPYLAKAITQSLPAASKVRASALELIGHAAESDDAMAVDEPAVASPKAKKPAPLLPEVEVYLGLLATIYLHDQNQHKSGQRLATELVDAVQHANRRTLDALGAKVYFYYARFHELLAPADAVDAGRSLRPTLLALHRTATLRGDDESTATLLNLVLRSLLAANLVEQADRLVAKSGGLPASASNNQVVRYQYYVGRIAALRLDYTASHNHLQQAIRKAPASPATVGFLQAATKLAIIVQLLMGEVPDRATFRPPTMRRPLEPYRQLVLAVRRGDLAHFTKVVADSSAVFAADRTLTLVQRLRHNVIKTGMRLLSVAYSAISLREICLRLGLDSEEDAEYMVAKAIRDGVLTAVVDHGAGVVSSAAAEAAADVYASREPQTAFHSRIAFCLDLHNASVKAMRYPDRSAVRNAGKAFADSEEVRELEKEIQQHLEDEGDEF